MTKDLEHKQDDKTVLLDRQGHGPQKQDRPSGDETRVNTAVRILAFSTPLVKSFGGPPNRADPRVDSEAVESL